MSKIKAELIAATGFALKRGEDENKGTIRMVLAVQDLPDDKWNALSPAAQDWFNAAANLINTDPNATMPAYPDAEPAAPARARVGRAAAVPTPAPAPEPEVPEEDDSLQVGWKVKITSLRGVVTEGVVQSVDEAGFVLDNGTEFDYDKVKECEVLDDGTNGGEAGDAPDDGPGDDEVGIGDTVQVTTPRGLIVVGNVKELGDDLIVLTKVDGTEAEFAPSRLKEIEIKVRARQAAAPAAAPAPAARPVVRRAGAAPAPAPAAAPAADAPRTRAGRSGGVSVGTRLREILAGNLSITVEQMAKQLAAEGFDAKEATITMQHRDSLVLIDFLRKNGKLK